MMPTAARISKRASPSAADAKSRRILLVDDNKAIHEDFRKILCPAPEGDSALQELKTSVWGHKSERPDTALYKIDSAYQGREALERVRNSLLASRPYALAFVDVRMPPGWDGIETIQRIWAVDSRIEVVICTAYSDYSWQDMVQRFGHTDRLLILKKPFEPVEARQMAATLTEKWHLARRAEGHFQDLENLNVECTQSLRHSHHKLKRVDAEREAVEQRLRQVQKMDALGQLAGGVAHDFNNMLGVILGNCELALAEPSMANATRERIEQIHQAGKRASTLTQQLLMFSRKHKHKPELIELNESVRQVLTMIQRLIGENISITTDLAADLGCVRADPAQIEQVIINLVVNARDALPEGGRITLQTVNVHRGQDHATVNLPLEPGPYVALSVSDTGCGMDKETLNHVFEPFFTTKEVGKGTGLGLATVYGIVKQSGGQIEVRSEPGHGTRFHIYLPRVQSVPNAKIATRSVPFGIRGDETVLIVEDEQAFRCIVRQTLEMIGYDVLEAADGKEALELCERRSQPIHLVVTDMVMPRMGGRELVKCLARSHPETKALYISGYPRQGYAPDDVFESEVPFLPKPFTPKALARKVRVVLDSA